MGRVQDKDRAQRAKERLKTAREAGREVQESRESPPDLHHGNFRHHGDVYGRFQFAVDWANTNPLLALCNLQ